MSKWRYLILVSSVLNGFSDVCVKWIIKNAASPQQLAVGSQQWQIVGPSMAHETARQFSDEPYGRQVGNRQIGTPYRVELDIYLVIIEGQEEGEKI